MQQTDINISVQCGLAAPACRHGRRAAAEHIARFYHNYHSLRYADDGLVLRLRQLIDRLNTLPQLPLLQLPERASSDTSTTQSDRQVGELAEEEPLTFVAPKNNLTTER